MMLSARNKVKVVKSVEENSPVMHSCHPMMYNGCMIRRLHHSSLGGIHEPPFLVPPILMEFNFYLDNICI